MHLHGDSSLRKNRSSELGKRFCISYCLCSSRLTIQNLRGVRRVVFDRLHAGPQIV